MYKITSGGVVAGYSDTAVFIKLADNGSYVPCDAAEADGVCVKLAVDFKTEDGKTETRLEDFVYKFGENKLYGVEPTGEIEQASGTLKLADAEAALELLGYTEG